MSSFVRAILRLSFLTVLLALSTAAFAQIDCNDCDPYNSYCSEPCFQCRIPSQDGCYEYWPEPVTCGGPCLADNCTPNWQETYRENRGTYGEALYYCGWNGNWGCNMAYACEHHRVDLVTVTDLNECNWSPSFRSSTYCEDYVDGFKGWSTHQQDCCSGFDANFQLDPTYTCNHYHSCS